jgi:hypothetical protein
MTCDDYGITTARAVGLPAWRVVDCRHIQAEENAGKHSIYVMLEDANGKRLSDTGGIVVRFSWDGMKPEETPPATMPDKPAPEPHCNVVMYPGMRTDVWVDEPGTSSDIAKGFSTLHPDEAGGNTVGHHSFEVTFRKIENVAVTYPVDVSTWQPGETAINYGPALREVQANVGAALRDLGSLSRYVADLAQRVAKLEK